LVEDLISPLEKKNIKEQLADRQTKKLPAATTSRGGTTRRVVAKKAGGSHKGTEKGKKRASPAPAEVVEERGKNKRLKSVVEHTCNKALDISGKTNSHTSTVNRTMTAEANERITNERDCAHQGLLSAVRSGSNNSSKSTKTFDDRTSIDPLGNGATI